MPIQLRSLGLTLLLGLPLFAPLSAAGHYHDVTSPPCVIPESEPINLTVESGWQAVIACQEDGSVEVYYEAEQALPGEGSHEFVGVVEEIVPNAPTRSATSGIEAASP